MATRPDSTTRNMDGREVREFRLELVKETAPSPPLGN
jgi:hypothetical protein